MKNTVWQFLIICFFAELLFWFFSWQSFCREIIRIGITPWREHITHWCHMTHSHSIISNHLSFISILFTTFNTILFGASVENYINFFINKTLRYNNTVTIFDLIWFDLLRIDSIELKSIDLTFIGIIFNELNTK